MYAALHHTHFNPRSREGSDRWRPAPRRYRPEHFNPRSREGSDREHQPASRSAGDFNPRSREGSDANERILSAFPICISIHAPAKGATPVQSDSPVPPRFQSTLPRRERHGVTAYLSPCIKFQSTLPRRERHSAVNCGHICPNFNPRSREGSDLDQENGRQCGGISIHAPAKGATQSITKHKLQQVFQSTLPRRERRAARQAN